MKDVGAIRQRIDDFDQRNGGAPILVGEWFYYANGAVREYDLMGALIDPPSDEYTRLRNVLNYHRGRLAKAVREFDALKEQLWHSACANGEGIAQLKKLQTLVTERNREVNNAQAALEATDRGRAIAGAREHAAEERSRIAEHRAKLREIRV